MCGKNFKKVDHIDFEVKKRALFTPYKTGSAWPSNFEYSWLKTFVLHKLEAFDIVLETKLKIQKIFIFIL
jgi:hypothetical protein